MARIGVVADTHCPEFNERLPGRLLDLLNGVELIVHAGDVNGPEAIAELKRVAPVEAVRGDHDAALDAPLSRVLTVEGRRIAVVHGNRSRWLEEPQTLLWTLTLGHYKPHRRLPSVLRARFPDVDVIVFGHTHRALIDASAAPLVFNPGGVHQWNPTTTAARLKQRPGWFEWCWLQVARHIRSYPNPTFGILDVTPAGVKARVVDL
jgi:putative phosphoesterase